MNEDVITIKCSSEYKNKVKDMAKKRGMNLSEFMRHLVANEEKGEK
jgi:predicted DNA binding CopG/RHH family protein